MRATFALLIIIIVLTASSCRQQQAPAMSGPPVVPVSVAPVTQESVPADLQVVGTVGASAVVQIKSQIAGELTKVYFTEGTNVKQGDPLFDIDARPYEDALHQAQAAVERDRAQITQAEATLERDHAQARFAESDAARQAELNKAGLTPRSTFDQAQATAASSRASDRADEASIETAKAALAADQAAVETARLNVSFCRIRAPLAGRTGNLLVHPGNLVKVNDVALVVINRIAPIFVDFSVPEENLGAIRRLNANHPLPVKVQQRDGPPAVASGYLSVIDNTVDSTTGGIHLKATFDNTGGLLWPGQFVNVTLTLDTRRDAALVPSEAVQSGQTGSFVYAVKKDHTVEIRPVVTGRAFENKIVIEKGVGPGDTVVTDGQMRLFPGAKIIAVDAPKQATEPQ
ncbi:MAG: efflux RND transporter periplasmic adaptor subunit [Bryobacteraceae bacterium]